MKILIKGAGFINKGAEAMLLTTISELSKRIKEASFSAFVYDSEIQRCRSYEIEPIVVRNSDSRSILFILKLLLENPELFFTSLASKTTLRQVLAIKEADAVIDISGYAYWGSKIGSAQRVLQLVNYCRSINKPYIFLPQAWGPFSKGKFSRIIKKVCKNSKLLYARDNVSLDFLKQVSTSPVIYGEAMPDIAFNFNSDPKLVGKKILQSKGVPNSGENKIIGIIPNSQILKRTDKTTEENPYIRMLVNAVNCCTEDFGAVVVLMPHQIALENDRSQSDTPICLSVKEKAMNSERCFIISEDSAATIKSIIGCFDLVISSRFHSLIAGLSQQVPILAIGWSHKYRELLQLFDLEEYCLDYRKLNNQEVLGLLVKAWNEKDNNCQKIKKRLPILKQKIDLMFDRVAEIICQYES